MSGPLTLGSRRQGEPCVRQAHRSAGSKTPPKALTRHMGRSAFKFDRGEASAPRAHDGLRLGRVERPAADTNLLQRPLTSRPARTSHSGAPSPSRSTGATPTSTGRSPGSNGPGWAWRASRSPAGASYGSQALSSPATPRRARAAWTACGGCSDDAGKPTRGPGCWVGRASTAGDAAALLGGRGRTQRWPGRGRPRAPWRRRQR